MASKPTQRTMKELKRRGERAEIVERWNPHAARFEQQYGIEKATARGKRKDLFGFIDIVALRPGEIVGIQCTSGSNTAARVKKIHTECQAAAVEWLRAGGKIEVWGWRKVAKLKQDGTKGKAKTWEPIIRQITLEELA